MCQNVECVHSIDFLLQALINSSNLSSKTFNALDLSYVFELFIKSIFKKKSHHQLQDALDIALAAQAHVHLCILTFNESTSSASCSWWWLCYMSKRTYEHVLVLPSRRLVCPVANDDFIICRNAGTDMCLCCQHDI